MATHSQVSPRTVWTIGLNVLALVTLVSMLYRSWMVVSWILLALLLALALDPVVDLLQRKGLPRGGAVAIVMGATLAAISVFVVTLTPLIISQGQTFANKAPELIAQLREHAWVNAADERWHLIDQIRAKLAALGPVAAAPLLGIVKEAVSGVAAFFTVLTLSVFMLLFGGRVLEALLEWLAPERRPQMERLADAIHEKVGGYVVGALLMSLIGGVVTAVTALLLGNTYFLPLGLAMAFFSIIPYLGSALGVTLLVSTTFAAQGGKRAIVALVVLLVYGQLKTKLLAPLIQRHTIQMNPLIITLVMLLGTSIAGVLGTVLTLPIAGAVQVILQEALTHRRKRWVITAPDATAPPSGALEEQDHASH
ncbi:MAG: AI-2E family transporter [Myxococcaceae bacterium]